MHFPDKNILFLRSIALLFVCFVVFGMLDILDYVIIKLILISGFGVLAVGAIKQLIDNKENKKPSNKG